MIPATIAYKRLLRTGMDINKILKDLRSEREEIQRAIMALERVGGRRRGRPPQWMKELEQPRTGPKKPSKDKANQS
jgi:hypothetical protein